MDWKEYEEEIFQYFEQQYPDAEVTLDAKKIGRYTNTDRQIDILIEEYVAGNRISIVVDGKFFNKRVDVKSVESFIGMLGDLGAHKGLLISKEGFSEAAYNRAHFGPEEVELDILNFSELHRFQAHGAIPYAGSSGALVSAPFGWVIDAQRTNAGLATLYQQGKTLDQAMQDMEFMYIQFWDRKKNKENLKDLLKIQEEAFAEVDPDFEIEYMPTIKRKDAKTKLRIVRIKNYPAPEYTGFLEFKKFIFFCVMFSPVNRSKSNLRKLENVLKTALPIKVKHQKLTSKASGTSATQPPIL